MEKHTDTKRKAQDVRQTECKFTKCKITERSQEFLQHNPTTIYMTAVIDQRIYFSFQSDLESISIQFKTELPLTGEKRRTQSVNLKKSIQDLC